MFIRSDKQELVSVDTHICSPQTIVQRMVETLSISSNGFEPKRLEPVQQQKQESPDVQLNISLGQT